MNTSTMFFLMTITTNLFLVLAFLFAVGAAKALFKNKTLKKEILRFKKPLFAMFAAAMFFFALGFLLFDPNEQTGSGTLITISTTLFSVSYALLIASLSYFWHHISRLHKAKAYEPLFFIGTAAGVFIWLHYLFEAVLIPRADLFPFYKKVLLMIHPLAVALIFLLTLTIHPARKANLIKAPLQYISSAIFLYFVGYMVLVYSIGKGASMDLSLLHATLFLLSSVFFFIGFYIAEKTYLTE
ncbi:hypothetical protein JW826_00960 [Candidatus Woesearchaeota archaeon]|nr:hypothetical protein [Candidatus Woesearchaeota archaeon]